MSRRGMEPLLMELDKLERKVENNALEWLNTQMASLQSPPYKRFVRTEAEEETQAKAG